MRVIFKIALAFVVVSILVELNSGSLFTDIKGIFYADNSKAIADSIYNSDKIPADYLKLLHLKADCCNTGAQSDVIFLNSMNYKYRKPISHFVYKKEYYLQVYKMDSSFNSSLKKILKEDYIDAEKYFNEPYSEDNESAVAYLYKLSQPAKPSAIYLKLLGKNTQIISKNDSIAYYYSVFENFSIQYKSDGLFDLYGETKGNGIFSHTLLPIELLFIKRSHNLYLLTLSIYKNKDLKYTPGMLYNLIKTVNKP